MEGVKSVPPELWRGHTLYHRSSQLVGLTIWKKKMSLIEVGLLCKRNMLEFLLFFRV